MDLIINLWPKPVNSEQVTKERQEAYLKFCEEKRLPNFVPPSGCCFHCGYNVFTDYAKGTHKFIGERGNQYITGCPHCSQTFCD